MAGNQFEFRYTANDVASAQRMRFFRSSQLKLMIGIWLASTLFLLAPLLFPQIFPGVQFASWSMVVQIGLAYLGALIVLLLATPYLDYVINRFWRLPLVLRFNEKQLRISVSGGKAPGLRLPWEEIHRMDENSRVIVLYYGTGNKYIVLPKTVFGEGQGGQPPLAERRFRDLLRRHAGLPAAKAMQGVAVEGEKADTSLQVENDIDDDEEDTPSAPLRS